MQTRLQSAAEAVTNTVAGLTINWVIVFGCMKLIHNPAVAASVSVALCTVHSLVRGYVLRRWFNGLKFRKA